MATINVTTLIDENDGGSGGTGLSLREAILQANSNGEADTIILPSGFFTLSLPGQFEDAAATGDLDILADGGNALTIIGDGQGSTTIDGNGIDRVFDVLDNASLTVSELTVTGGQTPSSGSSAERSGGGFFVRSGANLSVSNSTITGNSAAFVGGGINNNGTANISNSTISGNSARYGGGIRNFGSTANISSSTISGNSANNGGGISNYSDTTANISNSTISGNSANNGGGIYNRNSTANISSSTISGNSANNGGGIYNFGSLVNVASTIIAANINDNDIAGSPFNSNGNNLIGNGDGAAGFTDGVNGDIVGTTASPVDPLLGPLQNNGGPTETQALQTGSPAIDAGSNPLGLTTDQRGTGFPRVVGSSADIGAYEECFLTGTLILTDKGEIAVEALTIGDQVLTAEGQIETIKWIGRQTREPNQVQSPLRGYPILIKAGALGNHLPHRDLYVSPDHALLVDGLLINAGALVNDITILKTEPTETFIYHHVELENHALLIAEGAFAESYIPQKEDRMAYDNGAEYEELYPHGSKLMLWPMDYPRVSGKNKVPRFVTQKLLRIANQMSVGQVQLSA
jgi:hypothetical protein